MTTMTTMYVIEVSGGIEPLVSGPYATSTEQQEAARKFRNQDEDNISFWLDIGPDGTPEVGAYSGKAMAPDEPVQNRD